MEVTNQINEMKNKQKSLMNNKGETHQTDWVKGDLINNVIALIVDQPASDIPSLMLRLI